MLRSALRTYKGYSMPMKILGSGIGAAYMYYGKFRATHNDYIYVLLSGGLVGTVLYFWLLLELWKQTKPTGHSNHLPFIIASSTIVAYLIASMTSNVLASVPEMTYFSFIVGGAAGYYQRERQSISFVSR